MARQEPVVWQGQTVGYIADARGDMFDLYGTWAPGAGAATREFLRRLAAGEQLSVRVGAREPLTHGTVEESPGDTIQVRMRFGDAA